MTENKPMCPFCNAVALEPTWNAEQWRITTKLGTIALKGKGQNLIFDLLWRKRGVPGLTVDRIIDIIYADDIDGGPYPHAIIASIQRMRLILEPIGVWIVSGNTGGNGYSLAFEKPEAIISNKPPRQRADYMRRYRARLAKQAIQQDGPQQDSANE